MSKKYHFEAKMVRATGLKEEMLVLLHWIHGDGSGDVAYLNRDELAKVAKAHAELSRDYKAKLDRYQEAVREIHAKVDLDAYKSWEDHFLGDLKEDA